MASRETRLGEALCAWALLQDAVRRLMDELDDDKLKKLDKMEENGLATLDAHAKSTNAPNSTVRDCVKEPHEKCRGSESNSLSRRLMSAAGTAVGRNEEMGKVSEKPLPVPGVLGTISVKNRVEELNKKCGGSESDRPQSSASRCRRLRVSRLFRSKAV